MNQPNPPPLTPESLIQALAADCDREAKAAEKKLAQVIGRLRAGDIFAALDAFEEAAEMMTYLDVILKRVSRRRGDRPAQP